MNFGFLYFEIQDVFLRFAMFEIEQRIFLWDFFLPKMMFNAKRSKVMAFFSNDAV